jgi:hypothetical protein
VEEMADTSFVYAVFFFSVLMAVVHVPHCWVKNASIRAPSLTLGGAFKTKTVTAMPATTTSVCPVATASKTVLKRISSTFFDVLLLVKSCASLCLTDSLFFVLWTFTVVVASIWGATQCSRVSFPLRSLPLDLATRPRPLSLPVCRLLCQPTTAAPPVPVVPIKNVCATTIAPIFAILMLEHPPASVVLMGPHKRSWEKPMLIVEVRRAANDVRMQAHAQSIPIVPRTIVLTVCVSVVSMMSKTATKLTKTVEGTIAMHGVSRARNAGHTPIARRVGATTTRYGRLLLRGPQGQGQQKRH